MKSPCVFWLHQFLVELVLSRKGRNLRRAVAVHDAQGRIVSCNSRARKDGIVPGASMKAALGTSRRLALYPVPQRTSQVLKELGIGLKRFSPSVALFSGDELVLDLAA